MSSLSLKIKTERAFAEYLGDALTLGSFTLYEGHTPPDEGVMALPALVIYAEAATRSSELPAETGAKEITLRARFFVDSADGDRDDLDTLRDALEVEMRDIAAIQSALNKPGADPDNRTYKAIHFHDVIPIDEPSDREGTKWAEDMAWTVIVEPLSA